MGRRIPKRALPHEITVEPFAGPKPMGGRSVGDPVTHAALVVHKAGRVVDERPGSETNGQEIATTVHIVVHPEHYVKPGSLITIHAGTPAEAKVQVVKAAYNTHTIAPESAQFWTV